MLHLVSGVVERFYFLTFDLPRATTLVLNKKRMQTEAGTEHNLIYYCYYIILHHFVTNPWSVASG